MDASRACKRSALVFATLLVVAFRPDGIDAQQNAITGPGTISGGVRWTKTDAEPTAGPNTKYGPTNLCGALNVWATNPKMKSALPGPTALGMPDVTPKPVDRGAQRECDYTITKLPVDVALQVNVTKTCQVTWYDAQNRSVAPSGQPEGWNGMITILAPRPATSGSLPNGGNRPVVNAPTGAAGGTANAPTGSGGTATVKAGPNLGAATLTMQTRHNPTGVVSVTGIDFTLKFVPAVSLAPEQQAPPPFGPC